MKNRNRLKAPLSLPIHCAKSTLHRGALVAYLPIMTCHSPPAAWVHRISHLTSNAPLQIHHFIYCVHNTSFITMVGHKLPEFAQKCDTEKEINFVGNRIIVHAAWDSQTQEDLHPHDRPFP
jgi:hypothetical protein